MGRRPLNVYDILEKLVRGEALHGYEQESALAVVTDLRKVNAFGTITGQTSVGEHECIPYDTKRAETACTICARKMINVNGTYV